MKSGTAFTAYQLLRPFCCQHAGAVAVPGSNGILTRGNGPLPKADNEDDSEDNSEPINPDVDHNAKGVKEHEDDLATLNTAVAKKKIHHYYVLLSR
ncbi:hypothetical protein PCASD_20386 [Puccinia coronata f. sp. avenae]|uniref:Uncharacterized protein n=1 Tax=Puccinia coronata f. sp. avenae TaxID=200324 RepID=A0A2N5TVA3_9BASI|nr:hypothetical protein PCASD_20386 [Puccinia coronata f. sp. avenae]